MGNLTLGIPNFPGKNKLIGVASRTALKVSKHSPEICIATGIAAGVGATVLACRATLRVEEVIDRHNTTMENINKLQKLAEEGHPVDGYSVEEGQKEKWILMAKTICSLGKLYAPAIIVGSISIALILNGHNIMVKRNAALGVAYAGLKKAYDEYRSRVAESIGKEREMDIYNGIVEKVVEQTNDKGKTTKKKVVEQTGIASPYARIFDEASCWWKPDAEQNKFFLYRAQEHANDILKIRGHLFLNEVCDILDLPRTPMGQDVGWIKDGDGDGYVDFGLANINNERIRAFINGAERSIWLDFNVDGFIKDLI